MMLQALIVYAERENLSNADFEPVKVTWQIEVTASGKFAGSVVDLRAASSNQRTPMKLIRPFTRGDDVGHGRSHFLCDNLERALLYFQKPDPEKEASRKPQFGFFKALLKEAAEKCPNERIKLGALTNFLGDESELARARVALAAAKAKSNENAVFAVSGDRILGQPEIGAFWKGKRAVSGPAGHKSKRSRFKPNPQAVCLATGVPTNPVQTTRKVKGLWAGQGSGTNLIAFDKTAFMSYGLKKAFNAAISPEADVKVAAALERLIEKGLVIDPHGDRKKAQPVFLHWTKKPLSGADVFELVANPSDSDVQNLLTSPRLGLPASKADANAFYLMSLSANSTRIVVRDWLEATVTEVEDNVRRWFEALAIVNPDGTRTECAFKIARLVATLVPKKKDKNFEKPDYDKVPPQVPAQLLYAALRGTSLPQTALAAALRRQQVEQRKRQEDPDPKLNPARIALIKACLLRSPNLSSLNRQPSTTPMTKCLNPESRDPAYLCGRLFTVFERLQWLAHNTPETRREVNAGVVERFYASATVTPALVMARLFRNGNFHLGKAEANWGTGTVENVRKEFEEISCALGDKFPATLDLESQGRFALGY